jgi:hypothetical protein
MKQCSTFFTIREIKIKTTLRFHLTPIKWLPSREKLKQMLERMQEKGNPFTAGGKCKLVTMEIGMQVPLNIKKSTIYSSFSPGYITQNIHVSFLERLLHSHIYYCITHSNEVMESALMLING